MSELRKQTKDDLVYFTSPQLSVYPRLRHAFFTKRGGVSAGPYESLNFRFSSEDSRENVMENFDIAARLLGSDANHVARTTQKHTDNIVEVTGVNGFTSVGDGVDALITNTPGVVLCGFYADCQLVMLYDHRNKACGLVHAGWRGVAGEIVRKTIERMQQRYGSNPNEMIAADMPFPFGKDAEILVYCRSGRRSAEAAKKLRDMGFTNVSDFGGIIDWPYETTTD